MSTHVRLSATKLSILSIPRSRFWVFTSPILRLLYSESSKSEGSDSDTESESDGADEAFDDTSSRTDSSTTTTTNPSRSSISSNPDTHPAMAVDNTSKVPSNDGGGPAAFVRGHSRQNSYASVASDHHDLEEDDCFFHIALTPTECTVVCSATLMDSLFKEPIQFCEELGLGAQLLVENFLTLQVDTDSGYGSESIVELTKPLSENQISLFFLSSHFNDIVLVPSSFHDKVIHILTQNNFTFTDPNNFVGGFDDTARSPVNHLDLETATFRLFAESNIKPVINHNVKLLLTGARSGEVKATILKAAKVLSSTELIPSYFAITRTSINELSLVLPKSAKKRARMGFDSKSIIGSASDILIPITIDFQKLPLDSTGIVAGVASRLINGFSDYKDAGYVFEMNYLSMAKSGIIMIPEENTAVIGAILSTDVSSP